MIKTSTGYIIEHAHELPEFAGAKELFMDHETNNVIHKDTHPNPYKGDRICGTAVTVDDCQDKFYIPIRHETVGSKNIPIESYQRWHADVLRRVPKWINHNVKFDAHFSYVDGGEFGGEIVDTMTLAKLIDSDRGFGRGTYSLDSLSYDWLNKDISPLYQRIQGYLASMKTEKRYSKVPIDIMGEYACGDVDAARDLYRYMLSVRPEQIIGAWNTEIALTPVLFDMEKQGMRIDPQQVLYEQAATLCEIMELEMKLKKLVGFTVNTGSAKDMYEVLVNHLGMPVLRWTNEDDDSEDVAHNPSFDKVAMLMYKNHAMTEESPKIREVVEIISRCRKLSMFQSFFLEPYQNLHVGGILHPEFNQAVRTFRMSCKKPNAQQLDENALRLILPGADDEAIFHSDYSQVEFRIIVHYIRDREAIAAYARDPDTDFHSWVAEICGADRDPAKTINFMMAFGGGKKKTITSISNNKKIVGDVINKVNEMVARGAIDPSLRRQTVTALCEQKGLEIYGTYHARLPTLKMTSKEAAASLRTRGYVYNAYGARRHLPKEKDFRAFNSVVQSTAACLMKERLVAVAPRYNKVTRDYGMKPFACVHDALAGTGPREAMHDPAFHRHMITTLENVSCKLSVPIRAACGVGDKTWLEAEEDKIDRSTWA